MWVMDYLWYKVSSYVQYTFNLVTFILIFIIIDPQRFSAPLQPSMPKHQRSKTSINKSQSITKTSFIIETLIPELK